MDLADEIRVVSTSEAKEMARRLAEEKALLAGTSSGANVTAALQVAERLGPGKKVVTSLCGLRGDRVLAFDTSCGVGYTLT